MRDYCYCGPKTSIDKMVIIAAPADWQAQKAYRCTLCGLISHAVQEEVSLVRGPLNARAVLHAVNYENGQAILTWSTDAGKVDTVNFYPWPRRVPMSETEPLIFKSWELLMTKVAVILTEPKGPSDNALEAAAREAAKHQARGIAEVLAIQMKPFMESADHVVKCAVKKYKEPDFEVPGLGEHLWNPLLNHDGTPRTFVATPREAKAKPAARPKVDNSSKNKLDPAAVAGIKEAVGSGMFSKEDVASMFKVSLPTLEEALSS